MRVKVQFCEVLLRPLKRRGRRGTRLEHAAQIAAVEPASQCLVPPCAGSDARVRLGEPVRRCAKPFYRGCRTLARGLCSNLDMAFKTIALIGKYKSPEIAEPLLELARFLESRGVRVLLDP